MTAKCRLRSTGAPIRLNTKPIAKGGEGAIHRVQREPDVVAKIYTKMDPGKRAKLEVMLCGRPQLASQSSPHVALTWPMDLIIDVNNNVVGYTMPRIERGLCITDVSVPLARKKLAPEFNWRYLHAVARNVASVLEALHVKGVCVGDINPNNILIQPSGLVTIIDCDSFQVRDTRTGVIHPTPVGYAGYTAPELLTGQKFGSIVRTPEQDCFALAIMAFQLLFGASPFGGKWTGPGEAPKFAGMIRQGEWVFRRGGNLEPSTGLPEFNVLHPALPPLFERCFTHGHANPKARPTASEWKRTLDRVLRELTDCSKNPNHVYALPRRSCCWCAHAQVNPTDPFATTALVKPKPAPQQASVIPIYPASNSPPVMPTPLPCPQPAPAMMYQPPAQQAPNTSNDELKERVKTVCQIICAVMIVQILSGGMVTTVLWSLFHR